MHLWAVDPRDLRPIVHYYVCRGHAPEQWTFRAPVDDLDVANRVLNRWTKEYPGEYATIANRDGANIIKPVLLDG